MLNHYSLIHKLADWLKKSCDCHATLKTIDKIRLSGYLLTHCWCLPVFPRTSRTEAIYRTLLAYLLPHREKLLLYPPKNINFMISENVYNFNDSSVTHGGHFKRGLKPVRTKIGSKLKPDKQSSWVGRVGRVG